MGKVSHGHTKQRKRTPEYYSWANMKLRCTNPSCGSYSRYGACGISFCDRWADFKNFLEDMGSRPKDKYLERIDNSIGYCPENCTWATRSEQMKNRRPFRRKHTLGYTFVDGAYNACIWSDGKRIHLGRFATAKEAHQAFLNARTKYPVRKRNG